MGDVVDGDPVDELGETGMTFHKLSKGKLISSKLRHEISNLDITTIFYRMNIHFFERRAAELANEHRRKADST
mgnify:FL=1